MIACLHVLSFSPSVMSYRWTEEEFEQWCGEVAKEHRYSVVTSGFGEALNVDRADISEDRGYATQTAVFTRLDDDDEISEMARLVIPSERSTEPVVEYEATFQAVLPSASEVENADIAYFTRELIDCLHGNEQAEQDQETCMALLWSVWMYDDLRWLCQGSIEVWIEKLGIVFTTDGIDSGQEEIQLIVKDSNLYLCCKSKPTDESESVPID